MAIHPYDNESQTQWDRGGFPVMIQSAQSSRPIGFCDGTAADEAEIRQTAADEGAEVEIDRKVLKTGREIWTIRSTEWRDDPES